MHDVDAMPAKLRTHSEKLNASLLHMLDYMFSIVGNLTAVHDDTDWAPARARFPDAAGEGVEYAAALVWDG